MGISASLLLSAVVAILLWAVDVTASGINVHMIGAILLVVGIIGFVLSLFSGRRGAASAAQMRAGPR